MTGERYAESAVAAERALAAAERLDLPVEAAEALSVKGSSLLPLGRTFEGSALLRSGIALFEENGRVAEALTARTALVASLAQRDIVVAWEAGREGLAEARRLGLRARAIAFAGNTTELGRWMGEWEWSLQELAQFLDGELDPADRAWLLASDVVLRIWRGEHDGEVLAEVTALLASDLVGQAGDQLLTDFEACRAFAEGRLDESRERSHALARCSPLNAPAASLIAGRAAAWAHDLAGVREEAAALEATGVHGPSVTLRQTVLAAVVAGLEGRLPEARTLFVEARRGLLERGVQFEAALVALDMMSILGPTDPEALAAAEEAQLVLERLRAHPFLARLETLRAGPARAAPVAMPGT